jgi:predicted permease
VPPEHWLYTVPLRLRSLFRSKRVEQELDEELRDHLERQIEQNLARGLRAEEARYAALRSLGGIEQRKEECRDARGVRWAFDLLQDLGYGLRVLRKAPAFTAIAVLSLGLGIGSTSAIFGAADSLLLRRLPVPEPERLVTLEQVFPDGHRQYNYSYSDLERFRDLPGVFSGLCAVTWPDRYNVGADRVGPDDGLVRVSLVTGSYFTVLGVGARLGRALGEADDRSHGTNPVAVISDGYWRRRFGRAADVLGRKLTLGSSRFEVIGVMPEGFSGEWVGRPTDLWIPASMVYQVAPERPPGPAGGGFQYKILGRLAPGVSLQQARAAGTLFHRQLLEDPPSRTGLARTARFEVVSAARGHSPQRESLGQPLAILAALVGAVLLVACANVAGLLLARAAARRREMAVRLALGASRGRLLRQALAESLLLASAGGALGILVAAWASTLLARFAGSGPVIGLGMTSMVLEPRLDGRALAFTLAVSLLAAALSGLAPAIRHSRVALPVALVARGADSSRAAPRPDLRKLLVVCQVAVSLALLVGSGLFLRTLRNIHSDDLGIQKERLLLVWTLPGQTGRQGAQLVSLFATAQERISSLPGVAAASATREGLLSGDPGGSPPVRVLGEAPGAERRADWQMTVGPRFFETVGQRLLRGRDFTAGDTDATPRVVIVSESLARSFFGALDPIGRRLAVGAGSNPPTYVIVGVVADAKLNSPRARRGTALYYPYRQQDPGRLGRMGLVVRAPGDLAAVAAGIREELRDIDPRLPVLKIDTVAEQLGDLFARERLIVALSTFFAVIAVLLACLGVYGVVSYSVAQRTSEIGIRIALGATRLRVLAGVMMQSLALAVAGIVLGLPIALAAARLFSARLFGVDALDLEVFSGAALALLALGALAGTIPARRAAATDPLAALRCE